MSSSPSAKRRRGNDGSVVGFLSSWLGYFTGRRDDNAQQVLAQNQQMMERMEKIMRRMEEKINKLEGRENNGDREEEVHDEEFLSKKEIDSEEESMESNDSSDDENERKASALDAYQEMVTKNWNDWKYSAKDVTINDIDESIFSGVEILEILNLFNCIKECTIKMRRGEYHHEGGVSFPDVDRWNDESHLNLKGIVLDGSDDHDPTWYVKRLRPHWEEFAQALDGFDLILDVMPDDTETCFQISEIELPATVFMMIAKSLSGKLFRHYTFRNNDFGDYGIRALIDLVENNPELRSLTLNNLIDDDIFVDFLRAMLSHTALTKVNLDGCFDRGGGRHCILTGLISSNTLVDISMRNNYLSIFDAAFDDELRQLFIDSLASNTTLERLDLRGNNFNDKDAAVYATALERNKTLKYLDMYGNCFTENVGQHFGSALRTNNTLECLKLEERYVSDEIFSALFDDTSLNSASDSNHICYVDCGSFFPRNVRGDPVGNRQRKIYKILASRNETMSNVQHFDNLDINLLPEMLLAVQLYAKAHGDEGKQGFFYRDSSNVNELSIYYELMRKWDKAFSIYEALGSK